MRILGECPICQCDIGYINKWETVGCPSCGWVISEMEEVDLKNDGECSNSDTRRTDGFVEHISD